MNEQNKKRLEEAQKQFFKLRRQRRRRYYEDMANEMDIVRYQNRKTITKGNG